MVAQLKLMKQVQPYVSIYWANFSFWSAFSHYPISFKVYLLHEFCILADLEGTLKAANELLTDWWAKKAPFSQKWEERISNLNDSWADFRGKLFETVLSGFATATGSHGEPTICAKCCENAAVIRCHHCHKDRKLCGPCDQIVHENAPFHDRDVAVHGFYKPVPPTVSVSIDGQWVAVGMYTSAHIVHY